MRLFGGCSNASSMKRAPPNALPCMAIRPLKRRIRNSFSRARPRPECRAAPGAMVQPEILGNEEPVMVIVMQEGATEEQIQHVIDRVVASGFDVHRSTGASHTVLGAV